MTLMTRRAALGSVLLGAPAVRAQGPARPLRLVVPFAPGGGADVFARTFGPVLGAALGHSAVVENIGGGATRLGTTAVMRAAPDGQTLLVTNDTLAAIEALPLPGAGSCLAGLVPVVLGATAPMVLVTHPRSGLADAAAYAARLRGRQTVNVGVPGLGSTQHFASEELARAIGGRPEHIPYRGAGPMLTDLLGGTLDAAMIILGSVVQHLRDGRLVGLGVSSPQRSPVAPEVPSFAETVAPGFAAETWIGVLAPAVTPPTQLQGLTAASLRALGDAAVTQRLSALGFETVGVGPERFSSLLRTTSERFAAIARTVGLRAEDL